MACCICYFQGHVAGYPGQVYNTTVVTRTAVPGACYPGSAYLPGVPQSYPVGTAVPPCGAYVPPTFPTPTVPPPSRGYPTGYPAPPPYVPGPAPPPGNSMWLLRIIFVIDYTVVDKGSWTYVDYYAWFSKLCQNTKHCCLKTFINICIKVYLFTLRLCSDDQHCFVKIKAKCMF